MSLLEYLKSLLPSFGRERILDDIARMRGDLDESVLPSLSDAAKHFARNKVASQYARSVEAALQLVDASYRRMDLFAILHDIFKDVGPLLDVLEKIVEEGFGKDVEKEAITYRRASVLKFLEILSFELDFTSELTLRIIMAEGHMADGTADQIDSELTNRDKAYFEKNYSAYLAGLKVISTKPAALRASIYAVPEILLSDDSDEGIRHQFGANAIDPLKMNFVTPTWNPIYHTRMWSAERDIQRLHKAHEERRLVELRLHDLKTREDGKPNAHLQQQIERVEGRLKEIDFKIAKYSGEL